ncbi:MAG: amidohydrolase family protein [Dehalococcoidia bacterium]|nr:amidohydrolase family protein [Dehalococcoidia bacterium]
MAADVRRIIDTHVHLNTAEAISYLLPGYVEHTKKTLKIDMGKPIPLEDQVAEMRELNIIGWLLAAEAETTGAAFTQNPTKMIADAVHRYPDVFVGFASVDPNRGKAAEKDLRFWFNDGMKGLKLLPYMQCLYPNDPKTFPLLELCLEYNVPVVYHLGHCQPVPGFSKYGQPILLDDVAQKYPDLTIMGAHGGFPWMNEMYSVCWKHPNVYCDFADWNPRYLPDYFVKWMDGPLRHKVTFGTGGPVFPQRRSLEEVYKLPIRDETKEAVLYGNAERIHEKHHLPL